MRNKLTTHFFLFDYKMTTVKIKNGYIKVIRTTLICCCLIEEYAGSTYIVMTNTLFPPPGETV